MNLRPIGDHIIVKPMPAEELSKGGIIIPDTASKERPERGEVVSVGPGRVLDNGSRTSMEVKPGDQVVFKKYAPDEVKVEGQEFLVITMSDVMAVIE